MKIVPNSNLWVRCSDTVPGTVYTFREFVGVFLRVKAPTTNESLKFAFVDMTNGQQFEMNATDMARICDAVLLIS